VGEERRRRGSDVVIDEDDAVDLGGGEAGAACYIWNGLEWKTTETAANFQVLKATVTPPKKKVLKSIDGED
jgi:hypothetical protein